MPNKCSLFGGISEIDKSCRLGSYGLIYGAIIHIVKSNIVSIIDIIKLILVLVIFFKILFFCFIFTFFIELSINPPPYPILFSGLYICKLNLSLNL